MTDERTLQRHAEAARRFAWVGVVALAASAVLLVAAAVAPIGEAAGGNAAAARRRVPEVASPDADVRSLEVKLAGSKLIRPAQVQPAVKDAGAAQKLLERFKLQSVVQMGGEPVAYVRVAQGGGGGAGAAAVQTVRRGGRLLDFSVEEVEPGRVRLSLEGVLVDLTY